MNTEELLRFIRKYPELWEACVETVAAESLVEDPYLARLLRKKDRLGAPHLGTKSLILLLAAIGVFLSAETERRARKESKAF